LKLIDVVVFWTLVFSDIACARFAFVDLRAKLLNVLSD
jgi:hypothetical protein